MPIYVHLRELTKDDLSSDCRFLPEPESFDMYARSFAADIEGIEGVDLVTFASNKEIVVHETELELERFKSSLAPLLTCYWQQLRVHKLEQR